MEKRHRNKERKNTYNTTIGNPEKKEGQARIRHFMDADGKEAHWRNTEQ